MTWMNGWMDGRVDGWMNGRMSDDYFQMTINYEGNENEIVLH